MRCISYGESMKLNFMSFFNEGQESLFERVFRTSVITLLFLYGGLMVTMHGMLCYKWYKIYTQKNSYGTKSAAFDTAVNERAQLHNSKHKPKEKINFFNSQKKEQAIINNQLKALYYDPTLVLKTLS